MNIKQFTPKSVVLADVKAAATTYEGTFSEMVSLIHNNKVTLVTDAAGEITGLWVNSDHADPMIDAISGENFQRAYGCKPVMDWINTIYTIRSAGEVIESIDDTARTMVVNGEVRNLDNTPYVAPTPRQEAPVTNEASTSMDIPYDALNGHEYDTTYVKGYIRYTTGKCFAKGSISGITYQYDRENRVIHVGNLYYGRNLTEEEREGWNPVSGAYYNN